MHPIKVASVSLNQTPLDWEHNSINILNAIREAQKAKVMVLCCPELCITGYGCEDMFFSTHTTKKALESLKELAVATADIIVAVGLPIFYKNALYNTACLMANGKIVGFVPKQHLANTGVYYESRWFKAWPANVMTHIVIDKKKYPFGDLVFDCGGIRIGFEICEDAWVASRTGINLAKRNVDLILNPSASHFAFGKAEIRKCFVEEGAKRFMVAYIYANLLGNEAGRLIYDGDTLIAAGHEWVAQGSRFSFGDRKLTTAVIDIQSLRLKRKKNINNEDGIVSIPFKAVAGVAYNTPFIVPQLIKEEEFTLAVALGLLDYLRKSHAKGFVLNLSGGADSAACACLVYLMVYLSIRELGEPKFREKIAYVFPDKNLKKNRGVGFYLEKILCCLYQKTKNNSKQTWHAANLLTQSLGIPLFKVSIDSFVENYSKIIQAIINRPLNWIEDDISLQNVQARIRGPSAWMLANVKQFLLLSTSNRSEASVGYATMDGDTCGGLSPLAGIDKSFILRWLQWLETKNFLGIAPIVALREVNRQKPTAELRPLYQLQSDESDLMPYVWLDAIEQLFVRNKYSTLEILVLLKKRHPKESMNVLATHIEQFFVRFAHNQWKRERLAPSFHLDEESVDPKTWCRFPILSGNFKQELVEMWNYINKITN